MNTKKTLNIAGFVLVLAGLILKARHWPGASFAPILSAIVLLVSLFMFALKDNKENGLGNGLNYFLVVSLAIYIVAALFKIQQWPGAGLLMIVACGLSCILPLVLILQKDEFKVSKQFIILFFTFYLLVITLFTNNPLCKSLGCTDECTVEQTSNPMPDTPAH